MLSWNSLDQCILAVYILMCAMRVIINSWVFCLWLLVLSFIQLPWIKTVTLFTFHLVKNCIRACIIITGLHSNVTLSTFLTLDSKLYHVAMTTITFNSCKDLFSFNSCKDLFRQCWTLFDPAWWVISLFKIYWLSVKENY